MRVAGVLMVRFEASDPRPSWTADEMDEAVRDFVSGRVELLDGHNGTLHAAPVAGYLDMLWRTAEGLRYGGVLEDAAMAERLRRARGLDVSAEYPSRGRGFHALDLFIAPKPPPPGYLHAVAILKDGERPAYPGSLVWPDE
jgi:hypothetical protein